MALPTWGMLEKSQVDSETIEEAIARLIAEHNANETAHLGEGQSLQSHKAEEIIDHVVGSVVADKMSKTETIAQTTLDAFGGWTYVGEAPSIKWPGIQFHAAASFGAITKVFTDGSFAYNSNDLVNNFLFQFAAKIGGENDDIFQGYVGGDFEDNDTGRLGFRTIGSHIWGFVFNGVTETKVDLGETPRDVRKVFRMFIDKENVLIKFYIDGELLGSLGVPVWTYENEVPPRFYIKNNTPAETVPVDLFTLTVSAEQV